MLHLRVLLPVSVNPETRHCLYSLCLEYFPEDIQIVKTVAGLFCDVCCQIKVRARHAGTYSKRRRVAQNIMEKRIWGEQRWEGLLENYFISYRTGCLFSDITLGTMKATALSLLARELCAILTLKMGVVSTGKSPVRLSDMEILGKVRCA
jgi:hypothetical protein